MIKVISMHRFAEICAEAEQLASKYTGCRQRAKVSAASIIQKVNSDPGKIVDDGQAIGETIIYTYTHNLGTKRFPDTYKAVTNMIPIRQTEKMFHTMYRHTNKSNVICMLKED